MNARPSRDLGAGRVRVGILAAAGMAGRRIVTLLERDGFEVVARADSPPAELGADGTQATDAFVVLSAQGGGAAPGWHRPVTEGVPNTPIVLVTASADRREIREALACGASGVVVDRDLEERLGPTVRAVCAGQLVVPEEFREAVAGPRLSPREKQVLAMVVMGFTNRDIAARLFVAESTVKSHLSSAFRKLGVRSRGEATELILDSNGGLGTGILAIPHEPTRAADDDE